MPPLSSDTNSSFGATATRMNRDRNSPNTVHTATTATDEIIKVKRWNQFKEILRPASSNTRKTITGSSRSRSRSIHTNAPSLRDDHSLGTTTATVTTPMNATTLSSSSIASFQLLNQEQHFSSYHPFLIHNENQLQHQQNQQILPPRPHTTNSWARQKRDLKEMKLRNLMNDLTFINIPPTICEEIKLTKNQNHNISNSSNEKRITKSTSKNSNYASINNKKSKLKETSSSTSNKHFKLFRKNTSSNHRHKHTQKQKKIQSKTSSNSKSITTDTRKQSLEKPSQQLNEEQQQQIQQNYTEIIDARIINAILNEKLTQKDALIQEQMKMIEELVEQVEVLSRCNQHDNHSCSGLSNKDKKSHHRSGSGLSNSGLVPKEVEFETIGILDGVDEQQEEEENSISNS